MRRILELLCWLLPASRRKNSILRKFGHDISDEARIAPVIVAGVGRFEIGPNAQIWPFSVFKGLSLVRVAEFGLIKSWCWISAAREFQAVDPRAGTLDLEFGSGVGARSYLDCSGAIIVHPYANIGGNRAFVQTHEPDLVNERQTAGRVEIGHHSLIASCTVLLKGAYLPPQSVLAANSTLLASDERRSGVYAGSPATWKRPTTGHWFERTDHFMTEHIVDAPMGPETA